MKPSFGQDICTDAELDRNKKTIKYLMWFYWLLPIIILYDVFYGTLLTFFVSLLIFGALGIIICVLINKIHGIKYRKFDYTSILNMSLEYNIDYCAELLNYTNEDDEVKEYIDKVLAVRPLRYGDFDIAENLYSKNLRIFRKQEHEMRLRNSCARLHSGS